QFGDGPKALTAGLADVPPPPPRAGAALQFDGATANVDLGAGVVLGGQFTEEAWIYPTASQANASYGLFPGSPSANVAPSLWMLSRGLRYGSGAGAATHSGFTAAVLTLNAWNHIAATYDGTAYRIYVNGLKVHENTNFNGAIPVSAPVRFIGGGAGST